MDATIMEEAHSPLGPSALSRVLACPGSFSLSQSPEVKALARYRPSVYAARGTVAHRVAEALITGEPVVRETITEAGHGIEVDDTLVDAVQVYTEVCESLMGVADWCVVERRVSLDPYWLPNQPPVPVFGTSDFLAYHQSTRRLTVVDYKHGAGVVVTVENNPQVLAYAAGALLQAPGPVELVDTIIVQPNAPGEKVKISTLSALDVLTWVHDVLIPGIHRAETEPDTYVPGDACRFCVAVPLCPALHKRAAEQAANQFTAVDVSEFSPDEIAEELALADLTELWIKRIRELARAKLEAGEAVPGWSLVPTRPTRSWDDDAAVTDALCALAVPRNDVLETRLRSPAQIQKRVNASIWQQVVAHVQSVSSGTKLEKETR